MSRILIVEDHADIRRLIRMTLDFTGHHGEIRGTAARGDLVGPFSPLARKKTLEDLGVST